MPAIDLIVILICMLLSAFFSGMEIAFVSSSKLKIELDRKQGNFYAKIISPMTSRQSGFIGTMLVGNNIALVVYGIMMAKALEPLITQFTASGIVILAVQTIISTLIILVTAEFLPKTIFRINPNRTLKIFAVPVAIIYFLLYVPVYIMIGISKFFLRFFLKVKTPDEKPVFGRVDLERYLGQAAKDVEKKEEELEHEVRILRNALDFSKVKARECMVPRTEIVAFELKASLEELKQKFIATGLSKILIYRDSIDHIIGYTHSYEMFKKPTSIKSILLPVSIVPETMTADEILEGFIKENRSITVVVDEFGGTSGIITIEDVVEEIFGEIEDEHDSEILTEKQISESEYEFSARLEIDYLNEKYKFNLPESDDYETLAGFIIHLHESIPNAGEVIASDNFVFKIKEVSKNRIELVNLQIAKEVD